MTTQDPGAMRTGRAVGLVLIGIAVIAAVLGVITLIEGDDPPGGGAQPPATTTTNPPGGQPSGSATPPPPPGTGTNPPPVPPTTGQPPATTQTQPQPPPQPPAPDPRGVPVRIFNNSKVEGLAARAKQDFEGAGWQVTETGNFPENRGRLATSTAFFRSGTEEAAARALADRFNLRVEPGSGQIADFQPGVIVIVTQDYGSK
jgi:hypothetical protein